GASIWAVRPPARPPAAVATSRAMPSRRLMRCRPAVVADTELEVAITAARLMPAAALNGSPTTSTRNGTRNTPPPRPSIEPSMPARAPVTIVAAARTGVTTIGCLIYQAAGTGVIAARRPLDYAASFAMVRAGVLIASVLMMGAVSPGSFDLVIRDVRILHGDGRVTARATVYISSGRIVRIESTPSTTAVRAGRVIEGSGRTLIPGLIDAHVHVEPWTLPLFLK